MSIIQSHEDISCGSCERGNDSIASATQAAMVFFVCCCKHQVCAKCRHEPRFHGRRGYLTMAGVHVPFYQEFFGRCWSLLPSRWTLTKKTITWNHHLNQKFGRYTVYGILWYTPKKTFAKLKSWCLPYGCFPHVSCFAAVLHANATSKKRWKNWGRAKYPIVSEILSLAGAFFFFHSFFLYNDWAF